MRALRNVRSIGLAVALFFISLAAWGGEDVPPAPGLEGVAWRLIEVKGAAVPLLSGGKQPSLTLDGAQKKASGYSGCNNYFSTYELNGASLKFGLIGATRRACPEPQNGVETAFLQVLEGTRGWRIEKGILILLDGEAVLARFTTASGGADRADPASMTYRMQSLSSGSVTLVNGAYHAPAAPGSAAETVVKLTDKQAFGTMQGRDAGAVVLVASFGGTGSFYELAFLSRGATGWENKDTVLLGDRVKVHSVEIESDHVVVRMTTHGPQDPFCCPTLEVTKRFAVKENRLVPDTEGTKAGEPRIIGPVWQWVRTRYNNDTITAPEKPERYTIRFLENGNIAVKADCNQKGGTYTREGKTVTIRITHSTMAACEPGSLEGTFAKDLGAAAVFFLKDGDLYIDLKYDSGTMRFIGKKQVRP